MGISNNSGSGLVVLNEESIKYNESLYAKPNEYTYLLEEVEPYKKAELTPIFLWDEDLSCFYITSVENLSKKGH